MNTLTIDGAEYAVIPLEEYKRLLKAAEMTEEDLASHAAYWATRSEETFPANVVRESIDNPLRAFRKHRGLTLRTLSEKTGLSVGYLSDIENKRTDGSVKALKALAETLDVSLEMLTG